MSERSDLETTFVRVLAWRVPIAIGFGLLAPFAIVYALHLPTSGGISSLIVPTDPDYVATRSFQEIFPESQTVLLLLEFDEPFQPAAIRTAEAMARAARSVPNVQAFSGFDIYEPAHPGYAPEHDGGAEFSRFMRGAAALRRQGLWGEHFLGVAVTSPSHGAEARDRTLNGLDAALSRVPSAPMLRLRKVGMPYVESWIEHESRTAHRRSFALFGVLAAGFALFLYRSFRTLSAILLALTAAVGLTLGVGQALGYGLTIVSSLVPLTVVVTTLSSFVYIHSRYVDQPPELSLEEHHVRALCSKFWPVTASSLAAALAFAALAVSPVRPVREMGIWTAIGLMLGWLVAMTLFPALQRILRTPTGRVVALRSRLYDRIATAVPDFSSRHRWPLLIAALALSCVGLTALLGVPGHLPPVRVSSEGLDYLPKRLPLYRDMVFFRDHVAGLNVARVWVQLPAGNATDPAVLRALDEFHTGLEHLSMVSAVAGPTTFLRMREYLAGHGAKLPEDAANFSRVAADTESLLLSEPALRGFIDVNTLSNVQYTVTFRRAEHADYADLEREARDTFRTVTAHNPALRGARERVVGLSMLQAKVGESLIPTLTQSFAITAGLIFVALLALFRSTAARLLAMIPSVFAILVTFLGVRLFGGSLNVATILIATTVLGTTQNDQIHFFYHLQEADGRPFEEGLRHALRASGRAIFYATVINATGFMGLSLTGFPPLRQFGFETAVAFALAMLADFTALPGALWIVRGESPAAAR